MERYIHFCAKCSYFKVVESENIDNIVKCIRCGCKMHPMKMTEEQWKGKSKEEQINIVKELKLRYISDNQVSQNNDTMQDIIHHLAKIRRNTDTIKNILLFFFVMFIIGILILAIFR